MWRVGIVFTLILWAQQTIYVENFNSGIGGWTLNAGALHSSPVGGNRWVRGSPYSSVTIDPAANAVLSCNCQGPLYTAPAAPSQPTGVTGAPQSPFLYISYNPATFGCGGTPDAFTYIGAQTFGLPGDCLGAETYFAFSPSISIPAAVSTPVHLRFYWTGQAHSTLSGGRAYFRIGSGVWQQVGSIFRGQPGSWQQADLVLPAVTGGQTIQVGFQFFNDDGSHGTNVITSFGVDEVEVYYETVSASPTLDLSSVAPQTVCAGGSLTVSFSAQNFPPGTTYTAQLFDGSGTVAASASGPSPITLPVPNTLLSGTYQVRVAANTTPPTYSDTIGITVVNVQSLSCVASPNPALPGSSVTLEIRGTGLPSGSFNVQVDPGNGAPPLTQNGVTAFPVSFAYSYPSSGSYTVTFTVTHSASGCSGTCQATIQIGGERLEALALVPSTVCAGDSFYIQYVSQGITFAAGNSFTVEVRDGSGNVIASCVSGSTAPSGSIGCVIPGGASPGNYSVRLLSSDPAYATSSLTLTVSAPPVADFRPETGLRFCVGEPIQFSDQSQNATAVRWDFGDGEGSNERNPTHTYNQPGRYVVTLTAFVGTACRDTISRAIEIVPLPQASFTTNPPTLILPEQNVATFTNTSTGAVSYQWDFGNGQTSTAENPSATYEREGEYLVVLTAISAEGCKDTAQYILTVSYSQGLLVPEAFTPNGDGVNDKYIIRYVGFQNLRLSIYDRWGNLIASTQQNTPTGIIEWDGTKNGQPLPEGVYVGYLEGKTIDGKDLKRAYSITILR
ncbi:MAG: PKD domain-containing protein [Bacteroidia bacterium]|nr:PKD domain-containing protein [Bacteroidia bacterium]MDW8014973.1 PKD domain-containing protein [Bacteroidia bacterium]